MRGESDPTPPEEVVDGDVMGDHVLARSASKVEEGHGPVSNGDDLKQIVIDLRESLDKRLEDLEHRLTGDLPILRVMLTERDVARLIQCDVRTVRRLEKGGVLPPALRFGGSKRWRAETIEAWLDDLSEDLAR